MVSNFPEYAGLKIMAGQQTMSGQHYHLSEQTLGLLVFSIGHVIK